MPNPIISHQAPALFIKIKFHKWIDEVAICIGAFVPDFTLFSNEIRHVSHSLLEQLYWTVPITIILSMIYCRYIASILSNIANKKGSIPKVLRYFGIEEWGIVKSKKFDRRFFLVTFYSALIGGLTHLIFDFPSHPYIELFYPWVILRNFEFLWISLVILGADIMMHSLIWIFEDVILFITSLYLLRMIKKKDLIRNWYNLKT